MIAFLIIVIGICGAVFGALAFIVVGRQDVTKVLISIAGRWNADVVSGDLFTRPRLRLTIDGVDGEVTFLPGDEPPGWTKVHFNWSPRHRLRVKPESFWSFMTSPSGRVDVTVGDSRFDTRFRVESSDRELALQALTPPIRQGLLSLEGQATLDIGPAGVLLKLSKFLGYDRDRLVRFIDLAIQILAEARRVPGIVMADVLIAGNCPVCGHPVIQARKCETCSTPHHEDCWNYAGGCAIFGCSARKGAA